VNVTHVATLEAIKEKTGGLRVIEFGELFLD
jgi:hypothetical protein